MTKYCKRGGKAQAKRSTKPAAKRTKIPEDMFAKLMLDSRRTCNLCWQRPAAHVHHIVQVSDGGDNSEDNLVLLCERCHPEAHTVRSMARNLTPEVLRVHKTAWLDLVERFPLMPEDILQQANDVKTVRGILQQGDRRALYYPLNLEEPWRMFKSLDELREYVQKSGYRLIRDDCAREHVKQLYRALCEIEFLTPKRREDPECLYGMLGQKSAVFLELRRKAACFHLNRLAQMLAYPEGLFADNEFAKMGLEVVRPERPEDAPPCFARFKAENPLCRKCDYAEECRKAAS